MGTLRWFAAAITVLLVVSVLYWATLTPDEEPCSASRDLTAAAIASADKDEENLVDRALLNAGGSRAKDCVPPDVVDEENKNTRDQAQDPPNPN